jgi:hypothetical protein
MRNYWIKIVFGALAIFAVGMVIRKAINVAKAKVRVISDTSNPITIPFPFGIVPFKLDGTKLGTVERVTLLRDTPKGISNIHLVVDLADSVAATALEKCLLVIDHPQNIDENTTFRCQNRDTTGLHLIHYGEVRVKGNDQAFPLLLPEQAVADLRSEGADARMEADADSISEAASNLADSITERADSIRDAAMERADSIRENALRMADSIRNNRRSHPPRPPQARPRR